MAPQPAPQHPRHRLPPLRGVPPPPERGKRSPPQQFPISPDAPDNRKQRTPGTIRRGTNPHVSGKVLQGETRHSHVSLCRPDPRPRSPFPPPHPTPNGLSAVGCIPKATPPRWVPDPEGSGLKNGARKAEGHGAFPNRPPGRQMALQASPNPKGGRRNPVVPTGEREGGHPGAPLVGHRSICFRWYKKYPRKHFICADTKT